MRVEECKARPAGVPGLRASLRASLCAAAPLLHFAQLLSLQWLEHADDRPEARSLVGIGIQAAQSQLAVRGQTGELWLHLGQLFGRGRHRQVLAELGNGVHDLNERSKQRFERAVVRWMRWVSTRSCPPAGHMHVNQFLPAHSGLTHKTNIWARASRAARTGTRLQYDQHSARARAHNLFA